MKKQINIFKLGITILLISLKSATGPLRPGSVYVLWQKRFALKMDVEVASFSVF